MRDYGKVFSRIWESADFRSLSEDGRTLVLYLLSCQHGTIAGVFRVPDGYACEDLQWSAERVGAGFAELLRKGFANRCETTKWVWVVKFLEWNPPENPNQRKSASKVASGIPDECAWKLDFMRSCGPSLGIDPPPIDNPFGTLQEPLPNQYQKQYQEQKGDGAPPSAAPAAQKADQGARLPKDWTLPDDWQAWCVANRPDLDPHATADSFRDFWVSKPGKDGRKTDWQATWRNWCRGQKVPYGGRPAPASTLAGAI